MSTRIGARRHYGRRKLRLYVEPEPVTVRSFPGTNPREAIQHWRDRYETPLFVYFIQDERGPVKIGQARNPAGRMSELQCGNPYPLKLRAVILAHDDTEGRVHEMWATCTLRGEWFTGPAETDLIARARRAQRVQIEQECRTSYDTVSLALEVLSQTGMCRG